MDSDIINQSDYIRDVNQSDTSDSGGDGNWFRYNTYVSTVLCVAYGLVFCIGLVGNSLVPFAVLRTNNQRRCVTNIFFVNLAIADLLVILACVPFTLVAHLINPWILGPVICKLVPYVQGISVCASVYTLVAIAVERYYSVCKPWKRHISPRRCRLIIGCIWIAAALLTSPWIVVFKQHVDPSDMVAMCTEEWDDPLQAQIYFVVAHLSLCYIVPLVVIVACYALVCKRVWYRKIPSEIISISPELYHPRRFHKSKLRAMRMLAVVVAAFALAWLPLYVTFARLKLTTGPISDAEAHIWSIVVPIAQWMSSANSCVNPVLYHFLDPRFRSGFSRIFLRKPHRSSTNTILIRQRPLRRRSQATES